MDVPLFMANRVLDNVFVGGCYAAEDEDFLGTNSIVKVINCCSHQFANRFQGAGIKYLSFQFSEDGNSTMFDPRDETITQVVRFVNDAIEKDECVLVHSMNGDSRSVCILAGYLVHRFHWPPHRALAYIATKRFSSKPNSAYISQLQAFAARRRAKYGEFKDIFGVTKGLKLNNQEILHRNTFLNATKTQPDPEPLERTKSIREILDQYMPETAEPSSRSSSIIQMRASRPSTTAKGPRRVTWRDGLITAQIPSSYSNFDANGRPLGSQTSMLFRPRTPSYRGSQQVRCIPVRMDQALIPAVSFDIDMPNHRRRADGYLTPVSPNLEAYAVIARPVSILAKVGRSTRAQYDSIAIYVSKQDFEAELAHALAERGVERPQESLPRASLSSTAPLPRTYGPSDLSSTTGGPGQSSFSVSGGRNGFSSTLPRSPGAPRPAYSNSLGPRTTQTSQMSQMSQLSQISQTSQGYPYQHQQGPLSGPRQQQASGPLRPTGGMAGAGGSLYSAVKPSPVRPGQQIMRVRPPTPPRRLDEEPTQQGHAQARPQQGLSSTVPVQSPGTSSYGPGYSPGAGSLSSTARPYNSADGPRGTRPRAPAQGYSPGQRPASQGTGQGYSLVGQGQPSRPMSASSRYGQQGAGQRQVGQPRAYNDRYGDRYSGSSFGYASAYSSGYSGYGDRLSGQRASSVTRPTGNSGASFGSRYSGA